MLAVAIFSWALIVGCGGGASPVGVTGVVTLDGQPVPEGRIVFDPVAKHEGQRRDVAIVDGRFELPSQEGLLPDLEFQIDIKGFRETGRKYPNANMGASYDEFEQYIPSQYNTASTLRVVTSRNEDENQLTFDLVSKPPAK